MDLAKIQEGLKWPFPDTDAIHASLHLSRDLGRLHDALHETTHGHKIDADKTGLSLASIIVACSRIANLTGVDLNDYIADALEKHKPRE